MERVLWAGAVSDGGVGDVAFHLHGLGMLHGCGLWTAGEWVVGGGGAAGGGHGLLGKGEVFTLGG
jgi:hypothetical protein